MHLRLVRVWCYIIKCNHPTATVKSLARWLARQHHRTKLKTQENKQQQPHKGRIFAFSAQVFAIYMWLLPLLPLKCTVHLTNTYCCYLCTTSCTRTIMYDGLLEKDAHILMPCHIRRLACTCTVSTVERTNETKFIRKRYVQVHAGSGRCWEGSIDLISSAASVGWLVFFTCSEVKGMNGVLFLWKRKLESIGRNNPF